MPRIRIPDLPRLHRSRVSGRVPIAGIRAGETPPQVALPRACATSRRVAGALAAKLAMTLDLAPHVLGERLDRGAHLRRALLGVQGHLLQAQRRLGDELVADRRVRLLAEDDLEARVLGDLPADPVESLSHLLAHPPVDLEVTSDDLDLHDLSSRKATASARLHATPRVALAQGSTGVAAPPRARRPHHLAPAAAEGHSARVEGRPGGDHVVDQEHLGRGRRRCDGGRVGDPLAAGAAALAAQIPAAEHGGDLGPGAPRRGRAPAPPRGRSPGRRGAAERRARGRSPPAAARERGRRSAPRRARPRSAGGRTSAPQRAGDRRRRRAARRSPRRSRRR